MSGKLSEMIGELEAIPKHEYDLGCARDEQALHDVLRLHELSEAVWKLYKESRLNERPRSMPLDPERVFRHSLEYLCHVYFDLAIGPSESSNWEIASKERLLENALAHPESIDYLFKTRRYLVKLLSEDLREIVTFREMWLSLLCSCNRAFGFYDDAIENAQQAVEYIENQDNPHPAIAYLQLCMCYLDCGKHHEAIEACNKSIKWSVANTSSEATGWRMRAKVQLAVGNDLEAGRDNKRADLINQRMEERQGRMGFK